MARSVKVDAITTEVIRYELVSAAEVIKRVFKRTTTLDALYELNDFGISIYDPDVNLIADAPGIPLFSGPLHYCVKSCIEQVGLENLAPGDVLTNTIPYDIGSQPVDAALVAPVFFEGDIIAYTTLKAHMGDLGAIDPYPTNSTDMFQEGLMMPALWLYREGKLVEETVRLIKANSRIPYLTATNFLAGAAGLRAGGARVRHIAERYGKRGMHAALQQIFSHGERVTRQALREMPQGEWEVVDYMDNDGITEEPVKISVKVKISDGEMIVDLSDSAPQQAGPINSPYPGTIAAVRYVIKALTTPRLPANEGHFKPLQVIAPPGNMFHPIPPAPTFLFGWSQLRLVDLIPSALASTIPDKVTAISGGDFCPIIMVSYDSEGRGRYFAGGGDCVGLGAACNRDGQSALFLHAAGGVRNIPIEVREKTPVPVLIEHYELRQDSGGPGKFRGGLGVRKDFRPLIPVTTISVLDRTVAAQPLGLNGGKGGMLNAVRFFPNTAKEFMRGKHKIDLQPGEVVALETGGGAGWGDPFDRDPQTVLEDVSEGYVSLEAANQQYGVVIRETPKGYIFDEAATTARRQERQAPVTHGKK